MKLIDRLGGTRSTAARSSWLQYLSDAYSAFKFQGHQYLVQQTYGDTRGESIENSFAGYVEGAYKSNGVVFAVVLARLLLFTEARFQFQRMDNGRPGDLFGTSALAPLEQPWPNGTTGELLGRVEQDGSLAGNFYATKNRRGDIVRLRPDWVTIIHGSPNRDSADDPADDIDAELLGYIYQPGGYGSGRKATMLVPEQVAHHSPIPDPMARYRGMSWVTAALREIQSDSAATAHKQKFFEHAATPNLSVKFDPKIPVEKAREFKELMEEENTGVDAAYKTLYMGGGADVQVIGANMRQLDFKVTQGAGETRVCAVGGVPPVIVGLSEGLSASTYSNYSQARRKFGDHWARPSWRSTAASLSPLVEVPTGARLWYDDRDIPFLREDLKEEAEIRQIEATTIKALIDAGYEPDSVVPAVKSGDYSKLKHTGLFSVQLQPPGTVLGTGPDGRAVALRLADGRVLELPNPAAAIEPATTGS